MLATHKEATESEQETSHNLNSFRKKVWNGYSWARKLACGCHFDAIVKKKLAAKPSRGTEDKESRLRKSNFFQVGLKQSRPDFFGGLDLDLQRPL